MAPPDPAAVALGRRRWANTTPAERSSAARRSVEVGWQRKVDPDGLMTPDELAAAVTTAKTAYHRELGKKGAAARWGPSTNAAA